MSGADASSERWTARPVVLGALFFLIVIASLVPRLPWLASATRTFNSDEAVDALVMEHLLDRGEFTLYNWDTHYYGIVEGLFSLPFLAAGVAVPLASKLGSLVGFVGLLWAVFLLGRRLFGATAGLAAAAILAAFSPQVIQWSLLASGGYTLVVAWGTLTLVQLDRYRTSPTPGRLAALGFLVGFGLYIYELYLVYVAVLGIAWAVASPPWRALRSTGAPGETLRRELPQALRQAAIFLLSFLLGWAPKLSLLLFPHAAAGKRPLYALASSRQIHYNLQLLFGQCLPAFFGINPVGDPRLAYPVGGEPWRFSAALGLLLVAIYGAAWLAGLWRTRRAWSGVFARPPLPLPTEALLVLLVPVGCALFLLSPNPQDAFSNRYLLPWLSSLPVLTGAFLVQLGRRGGGGRAAAWGLGFFLLAFPVVQIARWHQAGGYLDSRWRIVHRPDDLQKVLRYLQQEGIKGGYGGYWVAYKATLLAHEQIIIAPLKSWDRYPAYTQRVAALPTEAYIFFGGPPAASQAGFPARLAGRRFVEHSIGNYLVYTSPDHQRLLPPIFNPRPLVSLRADVAAQVPASARSGETLAVPVAVTNRSDGLWSAQGAQETGLYRVALSYRWLNDRGRPVVAEGPRFRLARDLPPGAAASVTERILVPPRPGRYRLRLTLVQEGVAWFDDTGGSGATYSVEVTPPL